MIWGLFALAAGLTYCIQTEINKIYKIDGFALNTFRSLFACLMMAAFIPFMEWPRIPEYYIVAIFQSAVSIVCMMAQYNLAAKRNGRIACMHQPIEIMLAFSLWVAVNDAQRKFLFDNPYNLSFIMGAFIVFIISINFIRKNDAGWSALLAVVPIAVLYAGMSVVSKIALEHGESLLEIALNFVFLCNLSMFVISLPVYLSQGGTIRAQKNLWVSAGSVAFFHTISWVLACIAIILTPNPAYVSVIMGLAPIWFMAYYRLRGIKDDASPVAGVFMALAAIVILVASV